MKRTCFVELTSPRVSDFSSIFSEKVVCIELVQFLLYIYCLCDLVGD